MKLVTWEETDEPDNVILEENGDVIFYDDPSFYNFEIGDQIQYRTELGTSCYLVVEVEPASPFTGWGKEITIRAM